jgi:hypothetical protein
VNEWRPWYVDAQVAGWVALHQLVESTLWNKTNSSLSPHASVLSGLICQSWVATCNWMGWHMSWCSWGSSLICRYTRSYSNNLTFATVKVRDLDVILSHFSISVHRPYLYANGRGCSMIC